MGRSDKLRNKLIGSLTLGVMIVLSFPTAALARSKPKDQKKRYNVLMIISDDLRAEFFYLIRQLSRPAAEIENFFARLRF